MRLREKTQNLLNEINHIIFGKEEVVQEIFLTMIGGGHILLEDIPGTGKTTLALAFSKLLDFVCKRVQFTPDVLPSDLVGFSVYKRDTQKFEYQKGAVFCNLLLADEINRTSPKTQSALLEVMEERQVTVEGVTRNVPDPFFVIATQNPYGTIGTQKLPIAQMDRFMVSLSIGYPDFSNEVQMAKGLDSKQVVKKLEQMMKITDFQEIQKQVEKIYMDDDLYEYIVLLIRATRKHPYIEHGASPRATIALVKMAKASAWIRRSDFVLPQDIKQQFFFVVRHRIIENAKARMEGKTKEEILASILKLAKEPTLGRKWEDA
ncbi:AAA family ATPase [Anaerostipes sp.]|uniref:AAA family ATPase n=1 Tax=Anaerostipes sp. TaxID=1872530 RepID=UPI003FEFD621